MKSHGLKAIHTPVFGYRFSEVISGISFSLIIHEPDEYLTEPPIVTLESIPKELITKLTHVNTDMSLCYMDKEQYYLNPFEPEESVSLIIQYIRNTLVRMVDREYVNEDFEREFDAYWRSHISAYLISIGDNSSASFIDRVKPISGEKSCEVIIHNGLHENRAKLWLNARGFVQQRKNSVLVMPTSIRAIFVELKEPPQPYLNGEEKFWPPKSWEEILEWCIDKHPSASQQLIAKLSKIIPKSLSVLIVFGYKNNDESTSRFGVVVKFMPHIQKQILRIIGKKYKKPIPWQHVVNMMKPNDKKMFKRTTILDATVEYVVHRNIQRETLIDRKLAIIGCGTIGSHLACQLVKLGAGSGDKGELSLFDSDILKSENLGRHLLGEKYLGEFKSEAIKHYLEQHFSWALNCKAYFRVDSKMVSYLVSNYDVIIDATGNIPTSNMLAYNFRKNISQNGNKHSIIIHGWVDADGLAVRTLLDDGKFGCIMCLRPNGKDRFKVLPNTTEKPAYARRHFSCGNSFTPYGEGVAVTAAGLIQTNVIDYFSNKQSPRFRHIPIIKAIPHTKWQDPKPHIDCPCCKHG